MPIEEKGDLVTGTGDERKKKSLTLPIFQDPLTKSTLSIRDWARVGHILSFKPFPNIQGIELLFHTNHTGK